MRRGNVTSGGAFTAAFVSLAGFIVVLAVLGILLYTLVSTSMLKELDSQISEQNQIYKEVLARDGLSALIEVISKSETPTVANSLAVGVFDTFGSKLAGNIDTLPKLQNWANFTFEGLSPKLDGEYHLFSEKITGQDSVTIVSGQNMRLIRRTQENLIQNLLSAAALMILSSIAIGYWISWRTLTKLQTVSNTLQEVANGDITCRIPISASHDQIDRVSEQINGHLERLSVLTVTTKNTINSIAHDLRAPLNRASIKLQQLADSRLDATEEQELQAINFELQNLNVIFETILRISRIESAPTLRWYSKINLSELINEVQETYQPVLEELGIELRIKAEEASDLIVLGDESMVFQMIANLIENIGKYAPRGSVATISMNKRPNQASLLIISDNGPGIPESSMDRMLQPFERLETSRSTPGNGLGLALVNAIASHHGAKLTLKPNNPGLRVEIEFPPA